MDLEKIIKDLESRTVTSLELIHNSISSIEQKDAWIHAFLTVNRAEAVEEAGKSDERRRTGKALSPLDGVPIAIKDNFSYKNHTTTAGSKILESYTAPYDATVVKKLKDAGAIIVGQTNMDEFAMGSSTENSAYGATTNPFDESRVPGGSSGGSAAAVAAGMVPLAFGSDTGGSIRQPAAFCGVVGFKPTYGAVSRYGLLAMASSLDQIGPLATTVEGARIGFEAVSGFDRFDSTSVESPTFKTTKPTYTIGVPKQFIGSGVDSRILTALEESIKKLEDSGHTIKRDVDIPLLDQSVAIYYLIMPSEVSSNLARYDGVRFGLHGKDVVDSRTQGFGPEVKRRIMLGTYALSAGYSDKYYKRAQGAQSALTHELETVLSDVDCLIGPVTPELPFRLGEKSHDPLAMYLSDIFTIPVNLAGLPGISIPATTVLEEGKELPIAIQLIGSKWGEYQLFDLAGQIERSKV
jgi:aspartyl-tRNA(Asn)/glutamyl-tRNA(Gln) amidotransferase subunit A